MCHSHWFPCGAAHERTDGKGRHSQTEKLSGNNRFTKFSYPWVSPRSLGARSSAITNEKKVDLNSDVVYNLLDITIFPFLVILVWIFLSCKQTLIYVLCLITGSFRRFFLILLSLL